MPFSIDRFREAASPYLEGKEAVRILQKIMAEIEQEKKPSLKAALIRKAVELIEQHCSREDCFRIMQECNCLGQSVTEKAARLYRESASIDDWLAKMNENGTGGGHLSRRGKQIIAVYDRCYCGSVSQTREPFSNTFCHCSCGWLKQLFEQVLGIPVAVSLIGSIIQGDKRCKFVIDLSRQPKTAAAH
jgi:predicted hydrocarbon binding protein